MLTSILAYGEALHLERETLPTVEEMREIKLRAWKRDIPLVEVERITHNLFDSKIYNDRDILKDVSRIVRELKLPYSYTRKQRPVKDSEAIELWPPRVEGDMRIRRVRLGNLIKRMSASEFDAIADLDLDYILVANLVVYMFCFGLDWFLKLKKTGIMGSWNVFSAVSRKITAQVKRFKTDIELTKQKFAELPALLGYQQLPFPGDGVVTKEYNLLDEMKSLSDGGEEHGINGTRNWRETFKTALETIQTHKKSDSPKFITFEEYVKEGLWLTSGASSIGKIHWEFDKDEGTFKARKNMLLDVYTPDELYEIAQAWDGKLHNTAIVKNELGKVRLAVASSIEMYLHESYLVRNTGHLYKQWTGITLDENPTDDLNRTIEIQKLFKDKCYSLPFDYAGFDHQVTTEEVQWITENYFNLGKPNIPGAYTNTFNHIVSKTVAAYAKSDLTGVDKGERHTIPVTGGLPSGVRVTSLVGNIWNGVMTQYARKLVTDWLGYDPILHVSLRGDDSLIICKTALECYAVRLGYQSINAIGHSAKFGITQGEGEFLRTVTTSDSRYGWVCRAIPSVTQMKPWNPEPWSPNHQIKTIVSNIELLERRLGGKVCEVHRAAKEQWSQRTKQSVRWLHLPVRLGGLGLYSFEGWVTSARLSPGTRPEIQVTGLAEPHPPSWVALTQTEGLSYQQELINAKMVADDVPGIQKYYSRDLLRKYKSLKPVWSMIPLQLRDSSVVQTWPTDFGLAFPINKIPKQKLYNLTPNDSSFPSLTQFLREYPMIKKAKKDLPSLNHYLERVYPVFYMEMVCYIKRGWHKTDAVTLAQGDLPIEPIPYINPNLSIFVKKSVWRRDEIAYGKGRQKLAIALAYHTRLVANTIYNDSISRLYRY